MEYIPGVRPEALQAVVYWLTWYVRLEKIASERSSRRIGTNIRRFKVRYYQRRDGKLPDAWSTSPIGVNDIQAALAEQGTECRPGDILIMRTGYIKRYNESSEKERRKGMKFGGPAIGIASTEETVRWLYSKHFAALAGDTVSFEAWPPPAGTPFVIHEFALVWWGTPLGELWDLETLAELCEEHERWSFFLTSAPLHLKGGIGSPPGAIAIL